MVITNKFVTASGEKHFLIHTHTQNQSHSRFSSTFHRLYRTNLQTILWHSVCVCKEIRYSCLRSEAIAKSRSLIILQQNHSIHILIYTLLIIPRIKFNEKIYSSSNKNDSLVKEKLRQNIVNCSVHGVKDSYFYWSFFANVYIILFSLLIDCRL